MKKALFITIFIFISNFTFGQTISHNSIVINIDSEKILDSNSRNLSSKPLIIIRQNNETNVFALFPLGGTETDVYLYLLADFIKFETDPRELDYATKRHDEKRLVEGQPLTINMTGLEDGEYLAKYISCNTSCFIKLTLKTDKKE